MDNSEIASSSCDEMFQMMSDDYWFIHHMEMELQQQRREPAVRIKNYFEETIPRYPDVTFQEHFRMTRSTFEIVMAAVGPILTMRKIPKEKKVLSFIWMAANTETYRSVADRFDFPKSSLHYIVNEVAAALVDISRQEIVIPSMQKLNSDTKKWSLPGVIGAVDGTYVKTLFTHTTPQCNAAYVCRKTFAAVQVQICCDSDLIILDIASGYPGSVHDARVFDNSPLKDKLIEINTLNPELQVLGDSAYPLSSYCLTPYRDNNNLTREKKDFNIVHSSNRVKVENCIGLLKNKFRRLKNFEILDMLLLNRTIVGCAVLHNIILRNEGFHLRDCSLGPGDKEDYEFDPYVPTNTSNGKSKRDEICHALHAGLI